MPDSTEAVLKNLHNDAASRPSGQDARAPFFDPRAEVKISAHKLPHWSQSDCFCFVTWRLDDSLPPKLLVEWEEDRAIWLKEHPKPWDSRTERRFHELISARLDEWLDAGHGSCVLKYPEVRKIVTDALDHFDGQRYDIASYVIMPNHVHVLLRLAPDSPLSDIMHSWKSFTSKAINKALNRSGALWQHEYWDRLIRNQQHFADCLDYINANPKKARLAEGSFTLSVPGSASVPPVSSESGQDARAPGQRASGRVEGRLSGSAGVPPAASRPSGQDARAPGQRASGSSEAGLSGSAGVPPASKKKSADGYAKPEWR